MGSVQIDSLTGGRQDFEAGCQVQHVYKDFGMVGKLLKIIQDEQYFPAGQIVNHLPVGIPRAVQRQTQRVGDGRDQVFKFVDGLQRNKTRTMIKSVPQICCQFQC